MGSAIPSFACEVINLARFMGQYSQCHHVCEICFNKCTCHTGEGKREKPDAGGAGLCTKLVFTILFLSFALTTTLFMMDYKEGQLAQVASTLPPEVQQLAKKADVAVAALAKNIKVIAAQALIKAEELSKKVPIGGDRTLADVVFNSAEKEAKKAAAEAAKLAAEEAAAEEAAKIAAEEAAAAEAARVAAEEAAAA